MFANNLSAGLLGKDMAHLIITEKIRFASNLVDTTRLYVTAEKYLVGRERSCFSENWCRFSPTHDFFRKVLTVSP